MIRALIVDDEELARRGIRSRLQGRPDIEVVGEAASGRVAVEAIADLAPDLLFLDIRMPGLDGFDVLDAIGKDAVPAVIFVTAFDRHALEAFEVHAMDYLLKPIDDDRFGEAVDRAVRRIRDGRTTDTGRLLGRVLDRLSTADDVACRDRFVIRRRGGVRIVRSDEIDWIEAAGDYAGLHVGEKTHLLRTTMTALEEQLDADRFIRIHRSTIVNGDRVRELRTLENGEFDVLLEDGTSLKLSRTYRDRLETYLGQKL